MALVTLAFVPALAFAEAAHAAALSGIRFFERSESDWIIHKNDVLIVDTSANMGYLMHKNGDYIAFNVATGQRNTVRYIGRVYNASTPNDHWKVLSKQTKGDRITFGKEGLFLRLFGDNGEEYTSYGIHNYAYLDRVINLENKDRYISMGCVLVTKSILDIIEHTYDLRNEMDVYTVNGLQDWSPLFADYINNRQVRQYSLAD